MLVNATLLIQDIQLLCFTVIFGVMAMQRWRDLTRRWLWYGFIANAAGAIFDLLEGHLPVWLSHGVNLEMIPLSYCLLNVAVVRFDGRGRRPVWVSGAMLVLALPFLLAWRNEPGLVHGYALGDLLIALEVVITTYLLAGGSEPSTRAPRLLTSGFLMLFAVVELARVVVAFALGVDPDGYSPKLEMTSAVAYIVNTSLLPLAFIWMMNARLESDLLRQSIIDPLTEVLNRRGLEQALEREMALFRRYGYDFTVAMLDLDHFKQFNDAYGHAAGDQVLIGVAKVLGKYVRETDTVGRFGGEEFVLLLPHTNEQESMPILENLGRALREKTDLLPNRVTQATGSFGAATTRGRLAITGADLLREADDALYLAKENGRDQVRFFKPAEFAMGLVPVGPARPAGQLL